MTEYLKDSYWAVYGETPGIYFFRESHFPSHGIVDLPLYLEATHQSNLIKI